jgi:hypothetical protein
MEPFSTPTTSRAGEHIPIREILNRPEIRNLMKELEPARSTAKIPKISYDELKSIVRTSGVELEELVSWREETWILPSPNWAEKKQTCQYQGKGKWLPIKEILLDREEVVHIEYENGLREERVPKSRLKWRPALPGGGRHRLVGTLFYRLLKVLSQKCAHSTCTNIITGINPEHLSAWHMGHIDSSTKKHNPADCRTQPLANAAEEYAKCQLECVECHDQRSNCSWKVNTGIKRKRTYDLRPYRPFTEIINSKEYQDFQNDLESSHARFSGKIPKVSFDQLKEITKRHLNFELEDLVTWDETVWNNPSPNHKKGITGDLRRCKVGSLEYAALKKLAGSCAVCSRSIVNVSPEGLSGWHMDHLENKKFTPSHGQWKKPKIAHEEYAKCVLKCSACHKQGSKASWEQ